MKVRKRYVLSAIVVMLVLSGVAVGFYLTSQPPPERTLDTSWVATANSYLENAKPYPNASAGDYLLAMHHIYLWENGTDQIVTWGSGDDGFYIFLKGLLISANQQVNSSVPKSYVDAVKATDRLIQLEYRFPTDISSFVEVDKVYFVLQDNLNEGLQARIIISHNDPDTGNSTWSIWTITRAVYVEGPQV